MAPLRMKITRRPAILVTPLLPTPKGLLYLSNLDDQAAFRFHIPAIQFYRFHPSKKSEDPAKVIREALAKVLVFYLWRSRTRALQVPAEQEVRFLFALDGRPRFDPPLPQNFYGNSSFPCAKTTAGELASKPLSFAAKLIREARTSVNGEYMRSVIDLMELRGHPLFTVVGTYLVSDITKMGFRDVDLGWGRAVYGGPAQGGVGPVSVGSLTSFFVPYRNTSGVEGIVVPVCLPPAAMQILEAEINETIEKASPFLRSSM